ncbi:MAG: 5-formyltetrahydrofolate cyclo-ligase, partial [Gammaproteobacteria bacterium]|nr:5-formyltetrahydrofolate cyclo-ligase [Gammaproteobacteria bacterium]
IGTALLFSRVQRVACYVANDGEMDLTPALARLWRAGKHVYLPALHGDALWFLPATPDSPMQRNRFGIPEPAAGADTRVAPFALDLVLMPLVAFDGAGNRLGMGGGFYDRTFAYLARRRHWRKPRLIGVAYGFQRVPSLPARPWDVTLEGVLTERGLERFA